MDVMGLIGVDVKNQGVFQMVPGESYRGEEPDEIPYLMNYGICQLALPRSCASPQVVQPASGRGQHQPERKGGAHDIPQSDGAGGRLLAVRVL